MSGESTGLGTDERNRGVQTVQISSGGISRGDADSSVGHTSTESGLPPPRVRNKADVNSKDTKRGFAKTGL